MATSSIQPLTNTTSSPLPFPDTSMQYTLNTKIMASVVVVLIIVIAFVASLHVYAKWFWRHTPFLPDRTRDRIIDTERDPWNRMSMESHRYNRPRHSMNGNNNTTTTTIGLDKGVIESLPIFSYKGTSQSCHAKPNNVIKENYALSQQEEEEEDDDDDGGGGNDEEEQRSYGVLECAVCLCEFEAYEKGRFLPSCHHSFHIDCIDMWFISHSTCPLCRAPVTYHNNEASSASASSLPLLFLLHNNNSSSNEEEWSFSRQHGGRDSCSSTRSFTPQIMSNHNLINMMESNVERYNPSMSNELYSNVMDKEGSSSSFSSSSSSQRTPQKSSSFRMSMKRLLSMERVGRSSRVVPSTTTCGSSSGDYDENHHDHLQEAQAQAQEKAEAAGGVKEESQDQMWPSDQATSSTVAVISL